MDFAKGMGLTDFTASGGWLDRFKKLFSLAEVTEDEILTKISPAARAEVEEDAKSHLPEAQRFLEYCQFTSDIDFSCINKIKSTLLRNMPYRQSSFRDFFQ